MVLLPKSVSPKQTTQDGKFVKVYITTDVEEITI